MTEALRAVGRPNRSEIPSRIAAILDGGLVLESRCLLLKQLAASTHPKRSAFADDTGYEAFVNHMHIDTTSPAEAAGVGHKAAHALARMLQENTDSPCRVILSLDKMSAVLRFHVRRPREDWVVDDLDSYAEPVLVLDYPPYRAYQETEGGYPSRADIEEKWIAIVEGRSSREDVHAWAEELMLAEHDPPLDPLVSGGLQQLHGFSLTVASSIVPDRNVSGEEALEMLQDGTLRHGPPGRYLRSIADLEQELHDWRARCIEYDANPRAYIRQRRAQAKIVAAEELSKKEPPP